MYNSSLSSFDYNVRSNLSFQSEGNYSETKINPYMDYSLFNYNFTPSFLGLNMFDDNYFDTDMSSVFLLYKMYFNNQILLPSSIPWKNYNTKTNLTALENVYDPDSGNKLANSAAKNVDGSIGNCLKYVREAMNDSGLYKGGAGSLGGAAYQSAGLLSRDENFKQVYVSRDDLMNLPAGCVIIFDKNRTGNETANVGYTSTKKLSDSYGHILITDGAGHGLSDHEENLNNTIYKYAGNYTVLVPSRAKKVDKTA